METKCTSSNRKMILHVLQNELGETVIIGPSPNFVCSVGAYSLLRDGRLTVDEDTKGIFRILASLGLCDFFYETVSPDSGAISYPVTGHSGRTLMNLFSIISSRQILLNNALNANKAFFVLPVLMNRLLAHPPVTVNEFLQALYGHDQEYGGIRIDQKNIEWTGFNRCNSEEKFIHIQLADLIMKAALSLNWVKPFTKNVRNRKYAFRTWLNMIGMIGPEYEEARQIMLGRLYGQSSQRKIIRKGDMA